MIKENIFDVVIGSREETLKWDALWRVIEWLATPDQAHGLDNTFRDNLSNYIFGEIGQIEMKIEFQLDPGNKGKKRWPDIGIGFHSLEPTKALKLAIIDDISWASPNNSRKIKNLIDYAKLAKRIYPDKTEISLIAISDRSDGARFTKMRSIIEETVRGACAFKILPLREISYFIDSKLCTPGSVVSDFKEWAANLESDTKHTK